MTFEILFGVKFKLGYSFGVKLKFTIFIYQCLEPANSFFRRKKKKEKREEPIEGNGNLWN